MTNVDENNFNLERLRVALTAAIRDNDKPWALNRERVITTTVEATLLRLIPVIAEAEMSAVTRVSRGSYSEGRSTALLEAATMLKRHGHRTAVTRVLELADGEVKTPARPQLAESPADEPGNRPAEPVDAGSGSTETATGPSSAQKGPTGLQKAIDATSAAEREHRERDAWRGHAPQGVYVHTAQEWEDGGGRG